MNVHSISQNHVILPNIFISSATWSLFRPACITKCVMYGIVLVKNVKVVFTLKQIYFSFLAQTAVMTHFGAPTNTSSGNFLEHQSLIYNLILKHTSTSCTILEQWNFGAPNQQYQE